MRLLEHRENGEVHLTKDLVGENIPRYAILSHTWGPDAEEVTFKDLVDGTGKGKAGYDKIRFCAEQAGRDGLQYFWVDTCCIDKSTSDELQASINSMFRWYRNADRCYVFLADVFIASPPQNNNQPGPSWEPAFRTSRWFTRGWTLQELLAPNSVEFFTRDRVRLGDKISLEQQIHEITGLPIPVLRQAHLSTFGVDERLSWAEKRHTTREEDGAYCLLGIFDVFIPLIYGEGKKNAMWRLRKAIDEASNRERQPQVMKPEWKQNETGWLKKLYTCPYRDRKDRNPPRVEGTCEWFTGHPLFQNWQQSSAGSLLWVSADPGCGKSVLAKYLADDVLPSTAMRTTCYFFFKDDFEDQRSSVHALCCILHQIFLQHPASLNQVIERFEQRGEKVLTSFGDLWDILICIATDYKRGEIICILDALDECGDSGRNQLIDAISKLYSSTTNDIPAIKFLLTSRPYLNIKRRFGHLERKLPTIHLSGENEKEVAKISREIDIVIRSRVEEMSETLDLLEEEQSILKEELTRNPNRTYLWVYLIFDEIENSFLNTSEDIRLKAHELPQTVDKAYNMILSKSRDTSLTKKLLHIVVAAARPLTLQEMALALAIKPNHRSIDDVKLGPEARFRHDVRDLCGLFITVVDSRIYLLHQTAREFLVPPLTAGPSAAPDQQWKFSLHPGESNSILAEICMWRLSLSDFNRGSLQASKEKENYVASRKFLSYSAQQWADHFREGHRKDERAIEMAVAYCRLNMPASAWFEMYRMAVKRRGLENFTSLSVASYFGLIEVVEQFLGTGANANERDKDDMTALHWAAEQGHEAVVQELLKAGAEPNAKNNDNFTPLYYAAIKGHEAVVQRLLGAGADANAEDRYDKTPLACAVRGGYEKIVQLLLEAGANVHVRNRYGILLYDAVSNGYDAIARQLLGAGANARAGWASGRTPLHYAAEKGNEAMVQQLLEAGASPNVEERDDYLSQFHSGLELIVMKEFSGSTPLHRAVESGHEAVVQQLLAAGASTKIGNGNGMTPLHIAVKSGNEAMVRQLLMGGANANAKGGSSKTPLHFAVEDSKEMIVQRLLEGGADPNAKDTWERGPLVSAAGSGNETLVQQLLDAGADANANDGNGMTPLRWAAESGHTTTVKRLLEAEADANAKDEDGITPLYCAAAKGHEAVLQQLLGAGADVNVKDVNKMTPLHRAIKHEAVVQQLLQAGADANGKDRKGETPLHSAAERGYGGVVQLLLEAGADVNTKSKHGITPLCYAASKGYDAIIQPLLAAGADINAKDDNGITPLHFAAAGGHEAAVQQLLGAGADVGMKLTDGITPLHFAAAMGYRAVAQQLLGAGADSNAKDSDGKTPLEWAVERGQNLDLQQLLESYR